MFWRVFRFIGAPYLSLTLALLWCLGSSAAAFPVPGNEAYIGNPAFQVPEKLRSRVNFWKDIFTKYDKEQIIIHHREYPQVIFNIVDLAPDAHDMSDAEFYNFRRSVERRAVSDVKNAIEYLATDAQPETGLQRAISAKMQFLGPGSEKYRRIIKEDLIRTQTGIRKKFAESVRRAGRYLPIIEKIFVEEYGLPAELTRLPFIESSFDYTAYSSVGAAGIWQFMPRTGKLYMTVSRYVDERRDPIESSRAAAQYLREAYRRLGTWPLAVTSYNHGVGGVASKVAKMGTSDISRLIEHPDEQAFGFASSNFYPEFLAALEVYENYQRYFPGLEKEPPIKAREVVMGRPVSAPYMAQQLGVGIGALQAVNYALMKPVWEGRVKIPAGYRLKVPHAEDLHLAYNRAPEPPPAPVPASSSIYGGVTYRVRRGDTLVEIAKKYNAKVNDIRDLNNLKSNSLKVGQTLRIKAGENEPEPVRIASQPKVKIPEVKKPAAKMTPYKVKSGDTLWVLSIKFNVPVDAIKAANKGSIVGNKLTGGKTILIPVRQ